MPFGSSFTPWSYNLGNFMRTLAFAEGGGALVAMTTLRDKLVKIGAKVCPTGRYVTFQLAEVAGAEGPVPENPELD